MRALFTILIVLASTGCATLGLQPGADTQQQALADLQRFAVAADRALTGLQAALLVEIELRKALPDRISTEEHLAFIGYVERVNDAIDTALVEAKSLVSAPVTRRDVVKRLLELARSKLEDAPLPISDPALRGTILAALSAVTLTLQVVLT